MNVQMIIGNYPFSTSTAEYSELRRTLEYRWLQRDRLNRKPSLQYQGEGLEEKTLNGIIHVQFLEDLEQPQKMHAVAAKGTPLNILASHDTLKADYLGQWVITRLEFSESDLVVGTPETINFSMTIKEYGEDGDL
jgi:phage protein U